MTPIPAGLRALVFSFIAGVSVWLNAAPVITQQPQATVIATSGQPATFSVQASGTGMLRWQWRHLGVVISGETNSSLTLPAPKMADAGFYDVVVTDDTGSVSSHPSRLMVSPVGGYPTALRLDTSFAPRLENNSASIQAFATAPDGSFFIAGSFTMLSGVVRSNLARFHQDGSIDPTFAPAISGTVNAIVRQPDGRIVIGGDFTRVGAAVCSRIARLMPDGTVDPSFGGGSGFDGLINAIGRQPDGRLVVGGLFHQCNGVARSMVARLNSDGSLDPTFDPGTGFNNTVLALALQSDGSVVAGGFFTQCNGATRNYLARLKSSGQLDPVLGSGIGISYQAEGGGTMMPWVRSLAVQSDGKILAGGGFSYFDGVRHSLLVRLNADGTPDGSFLPPSYGMPSGAGPYGGWVNAISVLADGQIVLAGLFHEYRSDINTPAIACGNIVRIGPTGVVDSSFVSGTGFDSAVTALLPSVDGGVFACGFFSAYAGASSTYCARLTAGGGMDWAGISAFRCRGQALVTVPVADGKWIIGGGFSFVDGVPASGIARLNADGTLDTTFVPGSGGRTVRALAVQGDERIIVGGSFREFAGAACEGLVRLEANGTIDSSFVPQHTDSGFPDVTSVALQPDGRLVLVGGLIRSPYSDRSAIMRLGSAGARDPAFGLGKGFDSQPRCVSLLANGGLLVGGYFSNFNDAAHRNVALLDSAGVADPLLPDGIGFDSNIMGFGTLPDGGVLAVGGVTSYGPGAHARIARFAADGSLDPSYPDSADFGYSVSSVQVQTNSAALVGINGGPGMGAASRYLARVRPDGFRDTSFLAADLLSGAGQIQFSDDGGVLVSGTSAVRGGATQYGLVMLKPDTILPTAIVGQPVAREVSAGASATFSVSASGTDLTYQWLKDGAEIMWAHSPTLSVANVQQADCGSYSVRVEGVAGSLTSGPAALSLIAAPTFAQWIAGSAVPPGLRGVFDTPAGDGVANLMKYALGVSPLASATNRLPAPTALEQLGQPTAIGLRYVKNPSAQGIRYALEVSANLTDWAEVASIEDDLGSNPDGTRIVRLREAMPPTAARRFARLKIVLTP